MKVACIVLVGVFAMACGQAPDHPIQESFHRIDVNKDHMLEVQEFVTYLKSRDPNGDGQMSLAELKQVSPHMSAAEVTAQFNFWNKHKDNVLDIKDIHAIFNAFDTNDDKKVSMHEYVAKYAQLLVPAQHVIG